MTKKTKKRFYRAEEVVWVHEQKKEAKVVSLDIPNQNVVVEIDGKEETLKLWEIDKLKYKAKDKFFKENPDKIKKKKKFEVKERMNKFVDSPNGKARIAKGHRVIEHINVVEGGLVIKDEAELNNFANHVSLRIALEKMYKELNAIMNPEVFFARIHPDAVVPTKRDEDAGFDLYTTVDHLVLQKGKTTLVPTGIATALPKTHYLNAKHERGSTGKLGMNILAGVIDSGFRGEIFVAITPLEKDVILSNEVTEVTDKGAYVLYPVSKAIAQFTIDLVPNTKLTELTLKELLEIESERGDTKLGQSGK